MILPLSSTPTPLVPGSPEYDLLHTVTSNAGIVGGKLQVLGADLDVLGRPLTVTTKIWAAA